MKSIAIYGSIKESDSRSWLMFYKAAKDLAARLGLPPTHVGISGGPFHSGKVLSERRMCKKITSALENGTSIQSLEVYSLPVDYEVASFDYNLYFARDATLGPPHILLVFDKKAFLEVDISSTIFEFSDFIDGESGEVFEMNDDEVPNLYASRMNPPASFKSLRILQKFQLR